MNAVGFFFIVIQCYFSFFWLGRDFFCLPCVGDVCVKWLQSNSILIRKSTLHCQRSKCAVNIQGGLVENNGKTDTTQMCGLTRGCAGNSKCKRYYIRMACATRNKDDWDFQTTKLHHFHSINSLSWFYVLTLWTRFVWCCHDMPKQKTHPVKAKLTAYWRVFWFVVICLRV